MRRFLRIDTDGPFPFVIAGPATLDDFDPECSTTIWSASTSNSAPPLSVPATGTWLPIPYLDEDVCAQGVSTESGYWQHTPIYAGTWDLNAAVVGHLSSPVGAGGLTMTIAVFLNGSPYRTFPVSYPAGALDFSLQISCHVPVDGSSDTISICIQQSTGTPFTVSTWYGWVDDHFSHRINCAACLA